MAIIDLNLLVALDALLSERSVTGAARRLGLSVSATSRTLSRLRIATGDPLLVQSGRSLAATPLAEELADRVRSLTREAQAVLSPAVRPVVPALLNRGFTIRANEGFLACFGVAIATSVARDAPEVRLRFVPKPDKDALPLRDGRLDLEIGTAGSSAPEIRTRLMFRDSFVGVARGDHALFRQPITAHAYAACRHVVASRRGDGDGPVDEALRALGLARRVAVVVPGFPDALDIARGSDLVALLPRSFAARMPAPEPMRWFELPFPTPDIGVAAMWHPRLDADPGHRWFRELVIAVCRQPRQGD